MNNFTVAKTPGVEQYCIMFHGEVLPHLWFGSQGAANAWLAKYQPLLESVVKIEHDYNSAM